MPDKILIERLLGRASALLLLLCLPASILWSRAGGAMFYLLCLAALATTAADPGRTWRLMRSMPALPVVMTLAVVANLASILWLDLGPAQLTLLPLLFAPAIAIVAARDDQAARHASIGAGIACALAFLIPLPEWPRAADDPTVGRLNAIVFAQLALVCVAHALAGAVQTAGKRLAAMLAVAAALGLLGVVLSGTRGVILVTPVILWVLWPHRHRWRAMKTGRRMTLVAFVAAVLLCTAALAVRSGLPERFARIAEDAAAYEAGEIGHRSIAARLALWRASVDIAREHPWLGIGASRFLPELTRMQSEGRFPLDAPLHAHPHSTVLSVLVQYGLAGLALLSVALVLAWRALGRAPPELRALGRALLCAWLLMGLSNDLFAHQNTLRVIAFEAGLIAALCARARTSAG